MDKLFSQMIVHIHASMPLSFMVSEFSRSFKD